MRWRGEFLPGVFGIGRVVHHDHRQLVVQFAIGSKILAPELAQLCDESQAFPDANRACRRRGRENACRSRRRLCLQGRRESCAHSRSLLPAVAPAARVPITSADSGSARSSTGASVVLKPKAFTRARSVRRARGSRLVFPVTSRCHAQRLARRAWARARRADGPPCRLPHRRSENCAARTGRWLRRAAHASAWRLQCCAERE